MSKQPFETVSVHIPTSLRNAIENEAKEAEITPGELYRTMLFLGLSAWAEQQNKLAVLQKLRKKLE